PDPRRSERRSHSVRPGMCSPTPGKSGCTPRRRPYTVVGTSPMFTVDWALRFAAALGIGLLLGLEREWAKDPQETSFAGVRPFALIPLKGAMTAFLQVELGQSGLALAVFGATSALIVVSYAVTASKGDVGMTTEVTALLAFLLGALCGWDEVGIASAAAVASL